MLEGMTQRDLDLWHDRLAKQRANRRSLLSYYNMDNNTIRSILNARASRSYETLKITMAMLVPDYWKPYVHEIIVQVSDENNNILPGYYSFSIFGDRHNRGSFDIRQLIGLTAREAYNYLARVENVSRKNKINRRKNEKKKSINV